MTPQKPGDKLEEAVDGRSYWRSLDELSERPEFRQWLEREFPEGASEWTDPVSRRHFVKIMSASFLLAGLGLGTTGCRRPEQKILPFAKMPEGYVHGVPQFYATAMPTRTRAIPLVVKSHDGRPVKIEGNALHPDSNGGTDRYAQASILNLYDPDRAGTFRLGGQAKSPEAAFDYLAGLSRELLANRGQGLCFLLEPDSSPSRRRLRKVLAEKLPQARWYVHDALDLNVDQRAAAAAFGHPVRPYYRYDQAKVVLALDCDFLGTEEDVHVASRRFAKARQLSGPQDSLNRLYAVESLYTVTGFAADHRLRIAASTIPQIAAAFAAQLIKEGVSAGALQNLGLPEGVDPKWITECARDLVANRGQCLVVAGHRQPEEVHVLAQAINAALGNIGKTVLLLPEPQDNAGTIVDLAKELNAGQVNTLVILGGNPVYTAPADLEWAKTQRKAKTVIRLGYYEDETYPFCDWHFPSAHYLESWGDAVTSDGTMVPIQPLIAPLFGGITELEVLARIGGLNPSKPYEIVRETFAGFVKQETETGWNRFLFNGFLEGSAPRPVEVELSAGAVPQAFGRIRPRAVGKSNLEVVFHRDYSVDDGRYNNNGWLQELPDPITKITWDNVIQVSRRTAMELGLRRSELAEVTVNGRTIRGAVWIQPGLADYSLGLALGYGRERTGRVGRNTGFNVYPLRVVGAEHVVSGAKIRGLGQQYPISCTQDHWSMEGRPIVREANLEQYRQHPSFARNMRLEEPPGAGPLYPNPLERLKPFGLHQWGMAIDLNLCTGCSACVLACQSENNVPIVGKEQVNRGREMQWLRIDRYYAGPPSERTFMQTFETDAEESRQGWIDNPQVVTQPMLCQHCEAAPCENVCPVNATSHDQEGLNVMTYNRCVGTRYCSNNCPYKVRRFNYFDYNKRPFTELYWGPFGHRKEDEWDLLKMIKNPEVTVRMRGVMEKCTYCLQRIESAKIAQKTKAGASGDVIVPEGTFTTACAQSCPSEAIVFGNLNDPDSRVSKLKERDRNYPVLEFLATRPRTTYLARIRNPNPQMPDYHGAPLTLKEYEARGGHPFQRHEGAPESGEAQPYSAVPQKGGE